MGRTGEVYFLLRMQNPSIFRWCQSVPSISRSGGDEGVPKSVVVAENGSHLRSIQSKNHSTFAEARRQNRTCRRQRDRPVNRSMVSGRAPRIQPLRRLIMFWDSTGGPHLVIAQLETA